MVTICRGETLLKILGAKWAPKFLNLGAHFNFQGPTSFEYKFAIKKNKMKNAGFAFLCKVILDFALNKCSQNINQNWWPLIN